MFDNTRTRDASAIVLLVLLDKFRLGLWSTLTRRLDVAAQDAFSPSNEILYRQLFQVSLTLVDLAFLDLEADATMPLGREQRPEARHLFLIDAYDFLCQQLLVLAAVGISKCEFHPIL